MQYREGLVMPLKSKEQAFHEFEQGTLHSGKGGPVVTNPKQAQAIALSVERRKKKRQWPSFRHAMKPR